MTNITIAKGDGIGPEIMEATLSILKAAGAPLHFEEIEIGEKVYLSGNKAGIDPQAWEVIRKNKVFLKAPITTPQGGGYKSLNVSTRKFLGLYANIRPCRSFYPFVQTKHPVMDMVIIRENEEDLYAGIEHQQTDEVVQCLKLISRPGCEKIIRYAFEYTKQMGRKKVSCLTKDNIMKQTDGLFHQVFKEIAAEYPDIQSEHFIIDIGAAKIADEPEKFDVVVTPNLYGDIVSDIAAQVAGSVGLAGSSNIGEECAMFEAVHGSAPDIAGMNMANPSGLIQAAVLMLLHINEHKIAEQIQNAWLKTIEDGMHTADMFDAMLSKKLCSTTEFTAEIINNLGKSPEKLKGLQMQSGMVIQLPKYQPKPARGKELRGVDVFVHWHGRDANQLADKLRVLNAEGIQLNLITNRGIKVFPDGFSETFCTDHWRCRFMRADSSNILKHDVVNLLQAAADHDIDVIKTENLYAFDGKDAFSLAQGQ